MNMMKDTETDKPKLMLVGEDGNAWAVLGAAQKAWRKYYGSEDGWAAIMKEAMSGDYDHLLQTIMKNFDVD